MKSILISIASKLNFFRFFFVWCMDLFCLNNNIWEKFNNKLKTCYPCKNRVYSSREIHSLYRDFLNCWLKDGYSLGDYFSYEFIRLNRRERNTYISDSYRFVLDRKVNSKRYKDLFENKAQFSEKFKGYMHRKILVINSEEDKEAFFAFCQSHPRICIKPRDAHRGMGVEIVDVRTQKKIQETWEKIFADKMIVEEAIIQNPVLATPHPQSVNTLRISTAIDKNNVPHIMACCFRMGVNRNCIDNFSGGGVVAPVDVFSGVISGPARDLDANYYMYHPTTGQLLSGFQVPEWETLKKIVLEVALVVPEMRYIGWDFSLNEHGQWELIEGNNPGGVHTLQLTAGRGLKKEYDKVLIAE